MTDSDTFIKKRISGREDSEFKKVAKSRKKKGRVELPT